jgi:hypothetical protein
MVLQTGHESILERRNRPGAGDPASDVDGESALAAGVGAAGTAKNTRNLYDYLSVPGSKLEEKQLKNRAPGKTRRSINCCIYKSEHL